MRYIITFNLLLQFTQFIHYPPLVFYHVYFDSFLLYFIVCISSCNLL